MAGLDLPTKLRRSLGQGRILTSEELAGVLGAYDADGDGHLAKAELRRFLGDRGAGGPWFCDMLTNTIWKKSQQAFEREVATLAVPLLARVLHFAMARAQRPSRRYVITPAVVRGEEPRRDTSNRPVDEPYEDLAAGRSIASRPTEPRGPQPRRPPAPRGSAPKPGPRARTSPARSPGGRPEAPRGPARPSGRPGPKRPTGRPRS